MDPDGSNKMQDSCIIHGPFWVGLLLSLGYEKQHARNGKGSLLGLKAIEKLHHSIDARSSTAHQNRFHFIFTLIVNKHIPDSNQNHTQTATQNSSQQFNRGT